MKNKKRIFTISMMSAVTFLGIAAMYFGSPNGMKIMGENNTFAMELTKANTFVTGTTGSNGFAKLLTSEGHPIIFEYENITAPNTNVFMGIKEDGYFANRSPLNSIKKVEITTVGAAKVEIDYGTYAPNDDFQVITASSNNIAYVFSDNLPRFLSITALEADIVIEKLKITYSCVDNRSVYNRMAVNEHFTFDTINENKLIGLNSDIYGSASQICLNMKLEKPITYLGPGLFYDCEATYVSLPETLDTIDGSCFSFSKLTSLFIPYGVTSIGDMEFEYCSTIKRIFIPTGAVCDGEMFEYHDFNHIDIFTDSSTIAAQFATASDCTTYLIG